MPLTPDIVLPHEGAMPPLVAADLQDQLLTAGNDLDRLQRLLEDAGQALLAYFTLTCDRLVDLRQRMDDSALHEAHAHLRQATTALQFQDMATQLIAHTNQRLRSCADRLASDALSDDDEGPAIVTPPPLRPNPVTQDEMDAGSIELF